MILCENMTDSLSKNIPCCLMCSWKTDCRRENDQLICESLSALTSTGNFPMRLLIRNNFSVITFVVGPE